MKIYLSPSAQPQNMYASGGTTEQAQCNRIADAAKNALERNGYVVKKAPEGQSYVKNTEEANRWQADVHVPIHTNAGGISKGTMGLCYAGSVTNKYVQSVYRAVADCTPWEDLGIFARNDLYEIMHTKMLCVYVECAFHDKKDSAEWIIKNVKLLGEAIAKGFCAADGKKYIPAEQETVMEKPKQVPGVPLNDLGIKYRAHVQSLGDCPFVRDGQTAGTIGYAKRLEGFWIDCSNLENHLGVQLKIRAKVHVQGEGWADLGIIHKDTLIGTKGKSKRLEAFILETEGMPSGYQLRYQTHIGQVGWTGWVPAGFATGSVGMKRQIEAIRIQVVKIEKKIE